MQRLSNRPREMFHLMKRHLDDPHPLKPNIYWSQKPGYKIIYNSSYFNEGMAPVNNLYLNGILIHHSMTDLPEVRPHAGVVNCANILFNCCGGNPSHEENLLIHTMHSRNNPFKRNAYKIRMVVLTEGIQQLTYDIELFYAKKINGDLQLNRTPPRVSSTIDVIRLKDLVEVLKGVPNGCPKIFIPNSWQCVRIFYKGNRNFKIKTTDDFLSIVSQHDVCFNVKQNWRR